MSKTRWGALAAALLLGVFALAGCSKNEAALDVQKAADELKAGVTFQDELAAPGASVFETLYDIQEGDAANHAVYVSSGATAEEIAVIEAKDANAAARVKTAVEQRIADLKEGFENYVPGEMTKLNNPVIEVKGKYVLLCICDKPDEARKVIGKLFS